MDVKAFATLLARSLVKRGIPKELAVKHAVSLVRTFDEEDLSEIASYSSEEEFAELSDSLAGLIRDKEQMKNRSAKRREAAGGNPGFSGGATVAFTPVSQKDAVDEGMERTKEIPTVKTATRKRTAASGDTREIPIVSSPAREASAVSGDTREIPAVKRESSKDSGIEAMKTKAFSLEEGEDNGKTRTFSGIKTSDISIKVDAADTVEVDASAVRQKDGQEVQEIYLDEEEYSDKVRLTKRGKKFFIGIAIATSPVTILLAALTLTVFALGIAAVCALIVATLLLVCTEAVAGSTLFLVGIIYGAIEIVSGNMGIGIYEIGLGICCGAVALAVGILTYNFAILVLPYVLKQLISFERYCIKALGPMLNRLRRECNRL